jgi:hypothetical protein
MSYRVLRPRRLAEGSGHEADRVTTTCVLRSGTGATRSPSGSTTSTHGGPLVPPCWRSTHTSRTNSLSWPCCVWPPGPAPARTTRGMAPAHPARLPGPDAHPTRREQLPHGQARRLASPVTSPQLPRRGCRRRPPDALLRWHRAAGARRPVGERAGGRERCAAVIDAAEPPSPGAGRATRADRRSGRC